MRILKLRQHSLEASKMSLPELDVGDELASCVLLVENEVLVRMALADELREAGLRVIEAANADEAMDVLESGTAVDLIFSDVQMPGSMDGTELARWAMKSHPEILIILTSGNVKSETFSNLARFLPKPYP